ncbi:hypothetical protein NDU88_012147 [Pleurodeles waltl]|uniref:Uncharacterized protein n=1 Tax=Pleurodeles waltl TaxID=8319 RepID=A0AAV7R3T5_PLEWA|nr:hypothetical protein NDU88_012147 [Pleurodeles waltl]
MRTDEYTTFLGLTALDGYVEILVSKSLISAISCSGMEGRVERGCDGQNDGEKKDEEMNGIMVEETGRWKEGWGENERMNGG